MGVYKFYKDLPPWGKGVAVVFVLGTSALAGYGIYKKIKSISNNAKARQEGKEVDAELKKISTKLSLNSAQISILSNQIHTAFDGRGTDWPAVLRVFNQITNDADLLSVIKSYGIRTINSGVWLVPDFEGTLPQAINEELSSSEVTFINDLLKTKGIKYRF
jgi:hypothetical protein